MFISSANKTVTATTTFIRYPWYEMKKSQVKMCRMRMKLGIGHKLAEVYELKVCWSRSNQE